MESIVLIVYANPDRLFLVLQFWSRLFYASVENATEFS